MLTEPIAVLLVRAPVIAPIVARPGELIVVWPGHPTHTLTVTDGSGTQIRRHKYVPDGALYGPLLILDADGVVSCVAPEDRQRLAQSA